MTDHSRSGSRTIRRVVMLAALLVAACGDSNGDGNGGAPRVVPEDPAGVVPVDAPGVTDSEIRFSAFGTGANNPLGICALPCFAEGIEAYFAFRNSEGGVFGRELVLSERLDDELGNNQLRALEIVSADATFAAFSTALLPTGWLDLAESGMPLYVWNSHPESAGHEAIFANIGNECVECTSKRLAYFAELANATTVAAMGFGISESSKTCVSSIRDTIDMYGEHVGGAEVGYTNDDLPYGVPNGVAPEVTAMKDAGVDLVYTCVDPNTVRTIKLEMQRQGIGHVPLAHLNLYDADFIAAGDGLYDGDIVGVPFRPFEADAAGSALDDFRTWMTELGYEFTEQAMYGWIAATTAVEAIELAGPEFDREKVIEASNREFTAYTAGGLIPPIDWSRQHFPPTEDDPHTHGPEHLCLSYLRVSDGALELIGDPAEPFTCWSGRDRTWDEPTARTFE